MITWMQKHKKYLVVTIWISVIAFVGAGFVGWGAYDFNLDRSSAIAKVGDEKITVKEFQKLYSNMYSYYDQMLDGKMTKEIAQKEKLEEQAIQTLISDALLVNLAKELGMSVNDEEVKNKLTTIEVFKNDGIFNKEKYYAALKNIQLTPSEFEEGLKKDILIEKLKGAITLKPSQKEVEALASSLFLSDRLQISIISADSSKISMNDEEVKNFWTQNKAKYMSVKSYDIEYFEVLPEIDLVKEEDLKLFWEENKINYKDKEDKVLSFEDAKEMAKKDLALKNTKKTALEKYVTLKKNWVSGGVKKRVLDNDLSFDGEKLNQASKDEVIKPFLWDDKYIIAKLLQVNFPEPMQYEDAKNLVMNDLMVNKTKLELENIAKSQIENFEGQDIGFIARDDAKKVTGLQEFEAIELLNSIFSTNQTRGYKLFDDKAVLYKIVERKLLNEEKQEQYKDFISDNAQKIKTNQTFLDITDILKNVYKTERYYKGN